MDKEKFDKDDYETLLFEHDPQKDIALGAMDLVKKYIINNKRILTGGMAIDMAMRAKDKQLYKDTKIPDYDFYSPNFHVDAYTIGEMLSKEYDDISIIQARHVSTMRVRVNFVVVADITYIPQVIYDKIPTIEYQGFIIVHPHYQLIDQHLALSLPLENPPMETIFGRWKKDIERYDLLNDNYPLNIKSDKIDFKKTIKYLIPMKSLENQCINGIAAMLIWFNLAKEDGFLSDWKKKHSSEYKMLFKEIVINDNLQMEIPEECYLSIISDNFEELFEQIQGNKRYFNELIDKIPRKILVDTKDNTIEIIDNRGLLTAAYNPFPSNNVSIGNLQTIMCYLLTLGIFYNNATALYAYSITQDILFWAAENYPDKKTKKYLPTCETYGKYNWGNSYSLMVDRELTFLKEKEDEKSTPRMAYPKRGELLNAELYNFEPKKSKYYQIDGNETEKFEMEFLETRQ